MSTFLNQNQQLAANHFKGPLLILAGAGSGKTRVITYRNYLLLKKGIDGRNILNVTFTQKAAKEMNYRIKNLCHEYPSANKIKTTTFHSLGLFIIKMNFKSFGYLPQPTIQTPYEKKEIITNILKEYKIEFNGEILNKISNQISEIKNNFGKIEKKNQEIKDIYLQYNKILKNYNSLDFDDLLLFPYELLKNNIKLRKKYQKQFQFIMVDEFQDTNKIQNDFLNLLSQGDNNLVVVGDDDQSIYSWRGADINNILNFEKKYPNSQMIKLEKNYRSTINILGIANFIIKGNKKRKDKNLVAQIKSGKKVLITELKNDKSEAKFIADSIQLKVFKYDIKYNEILILYRTKQQSKIIEENLLYSKIPYKVWGEKGFFERKEIKDIMALGKLMINPDDSMSFLRVINLSPNKRLKQKSLEMLRNLIINTDESLSKVLEISEFKNNLKEEERSHLNYFLNVITNYKRAEGKLDKLFSEYLKDIEYLDYIHEIKEERSKKQKKFLMINNFINMIKKYDENKKKGSLNFFFIQLILNLNNPLEEDNPKDHRVNLMTIHMAKGLEFNYVYITGLENDILPFYHQESDSQNLEEERRLFYVALTRAKKESIITYANERKFRRDIKKQTSSIFLKELPAEYITKNYENKKNFFIDTENEEKDSNRLNEKGFAIIREMLKK